jgi:hypothetical protein
MTWRSATVSIAVPGGTTTDVYGTVVDVVVDEVVVVKVDDVGVEVEVDADVVVVVACDFEVARTAVAVPATIAMNATATKTPPAHRFIALPFVESVRATDERADEMVETPEGISRGRRGSRGDARDRATHVP